MKIRVLSPFFDLEANENRLVGDIFDVTDKRYKSLKKNLLSDYFEIVVEEDIPQEKVVIEE